MKARDANIYSIIEEQGNESLLKRHIWGGGKLPLKGKMMRGVVAWGKTPVSVMVQTLKFPTLYPSASPRYPHPRAGLHSSFPSSGRW